jgi:hypothetical protein
MSTGHIKVRLVDGRQTDQKRCEKSEEFDDSGVIVQ